MVFNTISSHINIFKCYVSVIYPFFTLKCHIYPNFCATWYLSFIDKSRNTSVIFHHMQYLAHTLHLSFIDIILFHYVLSPFTYLSYVHYIPSYPIYTIYTILSHLPLISPLIPLYPILCTFSSLFFYYAYIIPYTHCIHYLIHLIHLYTTYVYIFYSLQSLIHQHFYQLYLYLHNSIFIHS